MGKAAEKADEQEGAAVMAKNRIKISILGSDYIIASEEEENYVRQIAAETEKRIAGITRDNPRLSVTMAAVLAALDYCDEAVKATESADNLRSQIKDYLEDSSQARMEADEARRENEKLKKDNEAYMAKFEAMSDYDELKAFKFAAEEKEKQEANMVKMCEVLDEISEKGVEMSEDERNAYIAKFSEYDSVAAWSNMVKAAEFDRVGAPSGNIHKIGLPYGEKKKSNGSIWDD